MTTDPLYTLEELAQTTDVTPRTIRFYTSEGLLPPPQARGRFALYGSAHRNRLRLIVLLKQALMPLATMRVHLPNIADAQVAYLLSQHETVSKALERADSDNIFPLAASAVGTPVDTQADAYRAVAETLTARQSAVNPDRSENRVASSGRRQRRALLVSSRLNSDDRMATGQDETGQDTDEEGKGKREKGKEETIQNPESWQRILLAPGVELHVRTPETLQAREHLDQVIAEARSLFQS